MTHAEIDARSLALHRLVAEKVRRDPSLLRIAFENLARWRSKATSNDLESLAEWERLLDAGVDAALATATEESERASTLRQASPFAGILTPSERTAFLRSWKVVYATHRP
jgi:hypothetical protein